MPNDAATTEKLTPTERRKRQFALETHQQILLWIRHGRMPVWMEQVRLLVRPRGIQIHMVGVGKIGMVYRERTDMGRRAVRTIASGFADKPTDMIWKLMLDIKASGVMGHDGS